MSSSSSLHSASPSGSSSPLKRKSDTLEDPELIKTPKTQHAYLCPIQIQHDIETLKIGFQNQIREKYNDEFLKFRGMINDWILDFIQNNGMRAACGFKVHTCLYINRLGDSSNPDHLMITAILLEELQQKYKVERKFTDEEGSDIMFKIFIA